ncbi:putative cysteine proteinase CG12163 [Phlebotomus argentipes]|uniref:putative cysteine proteinase CG12163 n=1 Tax=Phlebotomus argentipes TaxID=94469 RepID=UPI002892A67B|nr:putative cysteine proteinase CG12163 [Phlebotomus argentipes]
MYLKRNLLFLVFLTSVTLNCVFCGETEDVAVKNDKLDGASAELADERDSVQTGALELEHEVINDEQADQPTSGERFVAIHVDTMGAREELSPTLLGITHLALTFLPAEYQLLTVISAAREVVAGVRFILVVNAEHVATGERVVCSMEVFEKPWITTEWGDKWRMLEGTNCTGSPNPAAPDWSQYNRVNPIFTDRPKTVSEERLKEVEKQVVTTTPRDYYVIHDTTTELPVAQLSDEMKALLDAYFLAAKSPGEIVRENVAPVDGGVRPEVEEETIVPKTAYPQGDPQAETEEPLITSTQASEITPSPPPTNAYLPPESTVTPELSEEDLGQQQMIIDPFFTIDPDQIPPNGNIQVLERQKRELSVTETHKVQLESAIKEAKNREKCKRILANNQCDESEENVRECVENVLPDTAKLCPTEPVLCNPKSLKLKQTLCKPLSEKKGREKRAGIPTLGGVSEIDLSDESHPIHEVVKESLVSLGQTENGDAYSFVRINSATSQTVAGTLYKANLDVKDSDSKDVKCDLEVWERLWLNPSREVKFNCDNTKHYHFRQRRSLDNVQPLYIKGAPVPIPDFENDEKVQNLVRNSLVSFNGEEGNAYKLHRIVSATRKTVAGTLYEIDVEFKRENPEEVLKCKLAVWERLWLKENNSQTDVSCDENKKKYTFRSKRSLIYDHRRRDADYEAEEERLRHQKETLAHHEELFHKFQLKFSRAYHSSMEKSLRFRIFQDNLVKIQQLNEREMGTAKYGVTEFADLTPTEYRMRTGLWRRSLDENHIPNPIAEIPNIKLPKSFDWRDKNVVSEVKNQGNCGSCWAFSVTGNIEGLHAIKTGVLEEYSEQELLDCDTVDGACAGGLPDNAYKAIEQLGGLELESEYPYRARKGECVFNKTMSHVQVSGAVDLPKNETAMQLWLLQNGPISIGINANAMQFYRGGVSHPWRPLCRHGSIDHGVLIVGYGVAEYPLFNKTLPYWIVKNSWGPKWGEQGYYRVFRGDNTCGINSMASSAVLA